MEEVNPKVLKICRELEKEKLMMIGQSVIALFLIVGLVAIFIYGLTGFSEWKDKGWEGLTGFDKTMSIILLIIIGIIILSLLGILGIKLFNSSSGENNSKEDSKSE